MRFSVLTRPGEGQDGVYTNNFLALRVTSAEVFLRAFGGDNAVLERDAGQSEGRDPARVRFADR